MHMPTEAQEWSGERRYPRKTLSVPNDRSIEVPIQQVQPQTSTDRHA